MYQSHGISYDEYSRSLDQVLKVEKRREQDYRKSRRIIEETQNKPGL